MRFHLFSALALAGIVAAGAASAQTNTTTTNNNVDSGYTYQHALIQQPGSKHSSSRAEYHSTHMDPYNGNPAPISDD